MIYRIQSVYLILVISALVMLTFGADVFKTIVTEKGQYELINHGNVYGVQKDLVVKGQLSVENIQQLRMETDKVDVEEGLTGISTKKLPLYIVSILLTLLSIVILVSYKDLKRQLNLSRFLFIFSLLSFGLCLVLYYQFKGSYGAGITEDQVVTQLGFGFYWICIVTAFSFLALHNIKKDYKMIRSIDRLR